MSSPSPSQSSSPSDNTPAISERSLISGSNHNTGTITSAASDTYSTVTSSCVTVTTIKTSSTHPKFPSPTPSPTPPTTVLPTQDSNQSRYQRHILLLTNRLRHQHTSSAVTLNETLNRVARLHNLDVARNIGELSHISSDGRSLTERLLEQGYDFRYASENLARGQRDCKWVMNSWMKSPGHRRNVLNERVREMGLHVGVWKGRMYWCQVFGVRRG